MAREGKIHGVSVTIGLDKKPSGTGWTYAKEFGGAIVNRADQNTFEPSVFSDSQRRGEALGAWKLRRRQVGLHGDLQGGAFDDEVGRLSRREVSIIRTHTAGRA